LYIGLEVDLSPPPARTYVEGVREQSIFLNGIMGDGVQLGPLGTAAINRPIVPAPGVYDDGEIGGMMIGRGNRSTRRKPALVPFCPPQVPHAARPQTRTTVVGSQRLTASATVRPCLRSKC
jgi:hypothetical protein